MKRQDVENNGQYIFKHKILCFERKFFLSACLIILLSTLLVCGGAFGKPPVPLWGEYGVIVNDTIGNTTQQNPRIAKTSLSQYFTVWEDFRSGNSDLYIQKLDENGNRYWDKNGIPLCVMPNEQIYPKIVSDGVGGAYIVWQDNRHGNFDIFLQRINSNGAPMFQEGGIQVCQAPEGQVFPEMVSDGQGGVIITWQDYRLKEEDVYAQRVDVNGNLLWEIDGAPVCREKGTQWFTRLISDDQGGAFVVWSDRRVSDFDIFAQHLNYQGKPTWITNGIPICQELGNQDNPRIVSNGQDGFFVAWADSRPDAQGVYVQNINLSGKKLLIDKGVRTSNIFSGPDIPEIAQGFNQDAIIVWTDSYAGDPDIYMQKVSFDGKLLWGEESKALVRVRGAQENPKIFSANPYLYFYWEDLRNGARQIYSQKINQDGSFYYPGDGALVSKDQHNAQSPDIAIGENQSAIICYQDDKHGNFDIYAQRTDQSGKPTWGIYGKLINDTQGSVVQQNFKTASDNRNNVYFVYEDKRSGHSNIYVQKLNAEGFLIWELDGIVAAPSPFEQLNPDIVFDGKGGAYVVWEDYRDSSGTRIYAQHFDSQGTPAWDGGLMLTPSVISTDQKKPKIVSDGLSGAIVVFVDTRNVLNAQDVYSQRINNKGDFLFTQAGKQVSLGNGVQDDPVIIPNSLIIAWTDYRNGERNSDIFAQKIDLSGKVLWTEDGIPVCEAPDSQRDPAIVEDREGGVVIVWTDRGGGNYDIYGQKLDKYGRTMWLKDGVPICQTGRTQQRAQIKISSPGQGFVVWEDFRMGNWDIFAQTLNSDGRVGVSEEGISICDTPGTQYNPDLISQGKNFIVAWEDYRNNDTYNIYVQAFTPSGERIWGPEGVLAKETRYGARSPELISSGFDSFVLAWEDHRNGGRAIAAQKFKY